MLIEEKCCKGTVTDFARNWQQPVAMAVFAKREGAAMLQAASSQMFTLTRKVGYVWRFGLPMGEMVGTRATRSYEMQKVSRTLQKTIQAGVNVAAP